VLLVVELLVEKFYRIVKSHRFIKFCFSNEIGAFRLLNLPIKLELTTKKIIKMEQKDLFKMRAEASSKHIQAKLNETEADALEGITKAEQQINEFRLEIETCKSKRELLKKKFEQLKSADENSWEKATDEFIDTVEKLEDKGIFKTKTEEWFKTIRNISNELREGISEITAKW
jgi:chromosome segregation ATPase